MGGGPPASGWAALVKIGGAGAGGVVGAEEGEGDGAGGRRGRRRAPVTVAVSEIGLPMVTVGVAWVVMVATGRVTTEVSLASLHADGDRRVVDVAAVGGDGEETEVRLLAAHLQPEWSVDVLVCHVRASMPRQTHAQFAALGIPVDTTPYGLPDEQVVDYIAQVLPAYDVVVACQAVPFVYPALRRLERRPAFIEHGGLVSEALAGPKDLTDRYVGVCAAIRDAAAGRMSDRPWAAVEIPSMVDLTEFHPANRVDVRAEWGLADDVPVIGWVGRLDRKKRVEDVLAAASVLARQRADVRWMIVGGPNFFYPEHEAVLHALADRLGLGDRVRFLGDRADVPRLMAGMDALVWLSEGEGMPHVLAEAGAAGLPVVVTRDNGSEQQITDGRSGLFVPKRNPGAVAEALIRLIDDPTLRRQLGDGLRRTVEERYAIEVVIPQWRAMLDQCSPTPWRTEPNH